MKKAILLLTIVSLLSCSKSAQPGPSYPLTTLPGATYKAFSFTGDITHVDYYQYLHFTSNTSVDIYTADINGKVLTAEITYPYSIKAKASHIDSFEITYANGQIGTGFTTDNTAVITYINQRYNKVQ